MTFEGISKRYGASKALDGVDLQVAPSRITVLCGPPGGGKSVLLRLLVGLERPDAGLILLNGEDVTRSAAGDRPVGYVPQSFALYPHLSVHDNIAYPLALRRTDKHTVRRRVDRIAGLLDLGDLLGKAPSELSGGQKQRTALARGLIRDAAIYVLDDPLVGLDFKLRERLVDDLRTLRAEYAAAFLYATSDPIEALAIADDIAVLDAGRVIEHASADMLYHAPQRLRSAELVGFPACNVVAGQFGHDGRCETPLGAFQTAYTGGKPGPVLVAIRPEHLELQQEDQAGHLKLEGIVRLIENLGAEVVVHFDLAGGGGGTADNIGSLVTVIPAAAALDHRLQLDTALNLSANPANFAVFASSGVRLGNGRA